MLARGAAFLILLATGGTANAAPDSALATDLAGLFEKIPPLAHRMTGSVVLIPRAGGRSLGAFRWGEPAALRSALAEALARPPYQLTLRDAVGEAEVDEVSRAALLAIAGRTQANYVMLYRVEPAQNGEALIMLNVFDVRKAIAFEESRTVKAPELLKRNPLYLFAAGLLVLIVAFAALRLRVTTGKIRVEVQRDPGVTRYTMTIRVSKSADPPRIDDLVAFDDEQLALGAKTSRFEQTRVVADSVELSNIPPGRWYVHLFGVALKGGFLSPIEGPLTEVVEVKAKEVALVRMVLTQTQAQAGAPAPVLVEVSQEIPNRSLYDDAIALPEGYEGLGESFASLIAGSAPLSVAQPLSRPAWSAHDTMSDKTSPDLRGLIRYKAIAELGRGAMGVVYRARDLVLERDVALKLVGEDVKQHTNALKMFLSEAKALAALNHPNIVTVFDQGQDGNETFMVMELVAGRTLDGLLKHYRKLSIEQTLEIADQVCAGLAYAHAQRILHRDIKPANIFVSTDGLIKIGDFGLARAIDQLRVEQTKVCGTPLYMSPEQIRGTDVDFRADLYALGCTLFELLTGAPPFTLGEVMYHHMHTQPAAPSSIDPTIPAEIDALVLRCLEKEKEARFASADALRAALKPIVKKYGS